MAHTNKGSYGKLLIIAGSVNMSERHAFVQKLHIVWEVAWCGYSPVNKTG